MQKSYIHYGNDHFDMNLFNEKKNNPRDNQFLNKPPFGFWASPFGDEYYGWKEWCEGEKWHTDTLKKSFIFTLRPDAKILTVTCNSDIEPYLKRDPVFRYTNRYCVDFEKLMYKFDAMELIHGDNFEELHMIPGYFNNWDVDSIVIWNPFVILSVNKEVA